MAHNIFALAGQGIKLGNAVDFIAEEFDADGVFIIISKVDIHNIAVNAELIADKVHIVAFILQLDQAAAELVPLHLHTGAQADDHAAVIDRVAQGINAGNRRHNDNIAPLRQCRRGRMAQAVDLIIDGAVFFNIGIGGGDVGFRLVIVVIGDKIFHRIIGEKSAHLGADLTGQGFVWFQNQCGAVALCNDIGHRKGFAGAGNAQQSLTFIPCFQALHQRFNSLGLVASRFERCFEVEHLGLIFLLFRHSGPPLLLVVYLQLKFVLYNLLLSHYSIDLFNCKGNTA